MKYKIYGSSKFAFIICSSLSLFCGTPGFSSENENPYELNLTEEQQQNAKRISFFKSPSESELGKFIQQEDLDIATKGGTEAYGQVSSRVGLSIDGGGIRGVMPALWLRELKNAYEEEREEGINSPLWQIFDYVGGTSIGGIISLGVAAEFEPERIIQIFETNRDQIFSLKGRRIVQFFDFFGLFGHRYSASNFENLLKENFGEDKKLSDLNTNILVTACTDDGHPWLFKKEEKDSNKNYRLWEVARSTSAAPTYFDAYQPQFPVQPNRPFLVDGGIWDNNPSTLVTASIVKEFHNGEFNPNKIHLLSLGTGETNTQAIWKSAGKLSAGAIIEALMSSHNRGNHMLMEQLLGGNYHRVNAEMTHAIDLADVSDSAYKSMKDYAGKQEHKDKIRDFVDQTADIIRKKLENS